MKQKETRQEPVHQVLASYYLVIVYNSFTLQQQPARRLTGTDYQHFTANLENIWETLRACTAHSAPDFLKISDHFCHFDYFSIF